MKILIYGINYAPELTGIGKYTGEMCEWLAGQGQEVTVITAPPYYPEWKIHQGYRGWWYRKEMVAGVRVVRCPLYVPARATGIKRILHLLSFAVSSKFVAFWLGLTWRPDIVWVAAPAIVCAPAAWLAARLAGAKAWLHILDFEVDAAFDLGLVRSGILRRMVKGIEGFLMRRFDRVSTISGMMLKRVVDKGVPPDRTVLFPNWVDISEIHPLEGPSPLKKTLGIAEDVRVALCAGNMGEKQGLETLIDAARLLEGRKDCLFVLCGDGAARPRLEAAARGLSNVRFIPLQPKERLNELLNMADIHLLPQRAEIGDLVMPSRLTGMFASGRPVVAMASQGTQVAKIVPGHGIVVEAGEARAFADAICRLLDNEPERKKLGQGGRIYAESQLGKERLLRHFQGEAFDLARRQSK